MEIHHDCLLKTLNYLSWQDLNTFSLASKGCFQARSHSSLDQTRSGTISLGNGVSDTMEFIVKIKEKQWSDAFCGHRIHLRLKGLPHLSSHIESIDDDFMLKLDPMKEVKVLDCSVVEKSRNNGWLLKHEDYIDKGFAQGLALSLLFPNIREINMNCLSLTSLGVAWIAESNPALEVIRWEKSIIWPISNDTFTHLEAFKNLKEVYLDNSRLIFCWDLNEERLWSVLTDNKLKLQRLSIKGALVYQRSFKFGPISQQSLMKYVRGSETLEWLKSDLSDENIAVLQKERPYITFLN
jgi:hypothetical protein